MSDVAIRRAARVDAAAVARLVHALLDELSDGDAPAEAVVLRRAEAVLAADGVVAFVAVIDGTPVGVMTLNECAAIYAGGRFGEISELYVRPDLRSAGIAGTLIGHAQAEAVARGWTRIEVGAPAQPRWQRTVDFYLRNGFEEVGPRLRRLVAGPA